MLESPFQLFSTLYGPQNRCFPVNIAKFLRTTFLTEHIRWLLLGGESTHSRINDAKYVYTYDLRTKCLNLFLEDKSVEGVSQFK